MLADPSVYTRQKLLAALACTERSYQLQAFVVAVCWYLTLLLPFL